jgi:ribosomal protein L40E
MSITCKRCHTPLSDTAWTYCRRCAHVIIKNLRKERRELKRELKGERELIKEMVIEAIAARKIDEKRIADLEEDIVDLTGGR